MEEQKGIYELKGNTKPEKVQEVSTSSALKWQIHANMYNYGLWILIQCI